VAACGRQAPWPGVAPQSDSPRSHAARFPALAAAIAALAPPTLILDGEVVIFDAQLLSRVEWLRRRDPAVATPPIYMVFDLLRTGPHDLRGEPLRTRRAALERLVSGQHLIFPARCLAASGLTAWERGPTARVRGPGRQGRGLTLCRRAHAVLVEGHAARLSSGRARLPVWQPLQEVRRTTLDRCHELSRRPRPSSSSRMPFDLTHVLVVELASSDSAAARRALR
jgi:ATP dependent DNA ligase domain